MAGDAVTVKIEGLRDVVQALRGLPAKLRVRAVRTALSAGGRVFRDAARRLTPVLSVPIRSQSGQLRRKPGTVRDAISVRTSKTARRAGDVGVFVNVRPAKGATFRTRTTSVLGLKIKTRQLKRRSQRGADSPNDPFYWRWLEFGARGRRKFEMLTKAGRSKGSEALVRIRAVLGQAVQRFNQKDSQP